MPGAARGWPAKGRGLAPRERRAGGMEAPGPGGAGQARGLTLPGGLVVRIRRSHRRGPGSIPGQGSLIFFLSASPAPPQPPFSPRQSSLASPLTPRPRPRTPDKATRHPPRPAQALPPHLRPCQPFGPRSPRLASPRPPDVSPPPPRRTLASLPLFLSPKPQWPGQPLSPAVATARASTLQRHAFGRDKPRGPQATPSCLLRCGSGWGGGEGPGSTSTGPATGQGLWRGPSLGASCRRRRGQLTRRRRPGPVPAASPRGRRLGAKCVVVSCAEGSREPEPGAREAEKSE